MLITSSLKPDPGRKRRKLLLFLLLFLAISVILVSFFYLTTREDTREESLLEEAFMKDDWCEGADFNRDGKVDEEDRTILEANFGKEVALSREGDANRDGKVNEEDREILERNFGTVGCEGCFLEIVIHEEKTEDGIMFSLLDIKNVYGFYERAMPFRYAEEEPYYGYVLRLYDAHNASIASFAVDSARFLHRDDFSDDEEPQGGAEELPSGTITVVIPTDERIYRIGMEDKMVDMETGLRINKEETDLGSIGIDITCNRTCLLENEQGGYKEDNRCCIGLTRARQRGEEDIFVCVICGDGICSEYETKRSCPLDCE